jgi:hypothetical protein
MSANSGKAAARACDQETLLTLHRALFGAERDFPPSWAEQGFAFRDKGLLCGLRQHAGGPCGVLAVVQAMVIRELALQGSGDGFDALSASREDAGAALISCLAGIVWSARVGRTAQVVSCTAHALPPVREAAEHVRIRECKSEADVRDALQAAAGSYVRPRGGGVCLLLYSVLLTRGIAMVSRDSDFPSPLILPNGYCSQELVNLLAIGRAFSNVFDGERILGGGGGGIWGSGGRSGGGGGGGGGSDGLGGGGDGGGDNDGECTRLRGIPRRAPIGFLTLFERQGSLLHQGAAGGETGLVKVGANYKRPAGPAYVVQSEAHYSVLWLAGSANPELTDDAEEERYGDGGEGGAAPMHEPEPELPEGNTFDLLYFDQVKDRSCGLERGPRV